VTDVYHLHRPGINLMRGFDHVQFIRGQESDAAHPDVVQGLDARLSAFGAGLRKA
jgi:hypothetical protein